MLVGNLTQVMWLLTYQRSRATPHPPPLAMLIVSNDGGLKAEISANMLAWLVKLQVIQNIQSSTNKDHCVVENSFHHSTAI